MFGSCQTLLNCAALHHPSLYCQVKAAAAHNLQTNDTRRNLMGKDLLKQNFHMTHRMVLLLCCTHNREESRGKYQVKVKRIASIKTVITVSDSATFSRSR
jgi:hypothetical protein